MLASSSKSYKLAIRHLEDTDDIPVPPKSSLSSAKGSKGQIDSHSDSSDHADSDGSDELEDQDLEMDEESGTGTGNKSSHKATLNGGKRGTQGSGQKEDRMVNESGSRDTTKNGKSRTKQAVHSDVREDRTMKSSGGGDVSKNGRSRTKHAVKEDGEINAKKSVLSRPKAKVSRSFYHRFVSCSISGSREM
jgi:hypothetical protein